MLFHNFHLPVMQKRGQHEDTRRINEIGPNRWIPSRPLPKYGPAQVEPEKRGLAIFQRSGVPGINQPFRRKMSLTPFFSGPLRKTGSGDFSEIQTPLESIKPSVGK
jgi:hypothetical protein